MSFIVIIPARLASTRLPKKPLVDINGKPMILHMMRCALESGADRVIIATDHLSVASVVAAEGGEVCMTSANHKSGTERLAEVTEKYNFSDNTIIVNLQGDEPMLPANSIRKVAINLEYVNASMTTLASYITDVATALNPNIVKVVIDVKGYALYFSRSAIPWTSECSKQLCKKIKSKLLRHIGIYAYRASFLRRYAVLKPSPLENIEFLEQLRVLWYGEKIHVDIVKESPILGVDTLDDLEIVRTKISSSNICMLK